MYLPSAEKDTHQTAPAWQAKVRCRFFDCRFQTSISPPWVPATSSFSLGEKKKQENPKPLVSSRLTSLKELASHNVALPPCSRPNSNFPSGELQIDENSWSVFPTFCF